MEGISKFPYFHKFYLMLGQLNERQGRVDAARAAYQDGLKRCMTSAPLWRSLSRLEEAAGMVGKARNVLEQVQRSPSLPHSVQTRGAGLEAMFSSRSTAPSTAGSGVKPGVLTCTQQSGLTPRHFRAGEQKEQ